jgi:toxin ParE1/3/4
MPKRPPVRVRLSPEAEADLLDILQWSEERFGPGAAARYAELVIQALRDLEADAGRPGARQRDELPPEVYSYHLAGSRDRVAGDRVRTPRHFILFQLRNDAVLDVLRILHDSRDLARHIPDGLPEA